MSYTVQVGKRRVDIEFQSSGVPVASITGRDGKVYSQTGVDAQPSSIAAIARTVVELAATAEQATIDQRRAIADAQRLLGR